MALRNAAIGTPKTAPTMPATEPAPATTSSTATGCRETALDISHGWSTLPSSCCTARMMTSMMMPLVGPWSTRATSTATEPDTNAPTIGMKEPKNTRIVIGSAMGTPRAKAPRPMPAASMAATLIWVRT